MEQHHQVEQVVRWAGMSPPDHGMVEQLQRLAGWLVTEGIPAGGLGPDEAPIVWERHVLDSLMFLAGWSEASEVVDAGTGVGLPGLSLAIARPDVLFKLVDRSGRRIGLVRRAVRVLGLENVRAVQADATMQEPAEVVVMRGVLQPAELPAFLGRSVARGGVLVAGGGRTPTPVEGSTLVRFPGSEILEPGRWLRIMRRP